MAVYKYHDSREAIYSSIETSPSELIDLPSSKKRKLQKQPDFKHLHDQIVKYQMEIHILKVHQKEIIQHLLNVEIERDKLKS